ncbi:MAG: Fibronectin type domain protein [Verrucomicrobiales bacterium]|nr:Fibronectin type domain protein [Verrucomicrobiales bacterium]
MTHLTLRKPYIRWKTVSNFVVLFCLLLAVPSSRSAPVVSTETKLTASDNQAQLRFGTSVAIDSGLAAVGAPGPTNGSVYTYTLVGTNWVQTQKLTDPAPPCGDGDLFGESVAMQNNILVVGQPIGCEGDQIAGQVFIYRLIGGTWVLQQTLTQTAPTQFAIDGFGSSVAISGNTIAVSNPQDPTGPGRGTVSIFTNNGTSWNFQAQVAAPTGTPLADFGSAVAIDGNTLLVGASGQGMFGAAYVFVRTGTTWTLQQMLTPSNPHSADEFGEAVALEGDTAVVGAPGLTSPLLGGAAFVFHRSGSTWSPTQELQAADGVTNSVLGFGSSISILNGTMVVGAPGRVINGQTFAGGADIFQLQGTSWILVQQIAATDPSTLAEFGSAVDIGASGIIVGAPFDSTQFPSAGAAYIFAPGETNLPVIISATATPNVLWPSNHKLVPVTINVNATGSFVSCVILGVRSNQPINGKGDGNTSPDWIITGDLTLLLRAERAGNIKTDRVYTITVLCADSFGNTARRDVTVTVPHDQRK